MRRVRVQLGTKVLARVRTRYHGARRRLVMRRNAARLSALKSGANRGARVALVSCDEWKGRVYDDLLLQGAFLRRGIQAEIVSWQDATVDFAAYDGLVIASMWGYQNHMEALSRWLDRVQEQKVFNSVEIIRENCDKVKQIVTLERYGLPIVPTKIVARAEDIKGAMRPPFVAKPSVSGGGQGTYLVRNEDECMAATKALRAYKPQRLLVQPYISEVREGELSVVLVSGEIVNIVRRFPGVLVGEYHVEAVSALDIPPEVREMCQQILRIPGYDKCLYMRVDLVRSEDGYQLMELELFEPQLFYYLLKGRERQMMLSRMVDGVLSGIGVF